MQVSLSGLVVYRGLLVGAGYSDPRIVADADAADAAASGTFITVPGVGYSGLSNSASSVAGYVPGVKLKFCFCIFSRPSVPVTPPSRRRRSIPSLNTIPLNIIMPIINNKNDAPLLLNDIVVLENRKYIIK